MVFDDTALSDETPLVSHSPSARRGSSKNFDHPTILPFSQLGEPPEKLHGIKLLQKAAENILLAFFTTLVLVCLVCLSPIIVLSAIIQRIYVARLCYRVSPAKQRIAVIGGGWGGLQCITQLHDLGVQHVKGFERYDGWGGTWHPALRYHNLQIHGAMWITSFKAFPYSKCQDINDGKVQGEEILRYVEAFGKSKKLMDAYTFNAQVLEIKYSSKGNAREAMLVLKDTQSGETWSEGPFDLVIYTGQASEPHIPNIPGRAKFKGDVYHSTEFKYDQYEDIVKNGKNVVVVGGSKAGCDLALCFQRGGYDKFRWLYRSPYLFWKYEVMFHDRSLPNMLRGMTTVIGLLMALVSPRISGWIFWTSGLAVSYDNLSPHNDWSKFHFGILCPRQRRDLMSIPKEYIVRGNPHAFTETGISLSDGTMVEADVVLFATGCESGIDKIQLTKQGHPSFTLQPNATMLDHFLVANFPVLANATALWTTFGPLRAVNSADMALYHLCVRHPLSEKEMERSAKLQLGRADSVSGFVFQKTNIIKNFLLIHLDLMIKGRVNVLDFFKHAIEIFCFSKQTALKMRLPPLQN